ncbi:MAG: hypothetical protein ACRC9R_02710, partial [Enterovibrio sp.]
MQTYPLESLTIEQAMLKQFHVVDCICRHFEGAQFLNQGDLGLVAGLNQPATTNTVEKVLADVFHAQAACLIQGAGTGAIRGAIAAICSGGDTV